MRTDAQRLVQVVRKLEQLKKAEEALRKRLLATMADNESIQVGKYTVTKRLIKQTVTDPAQLMKNGFDISRVTIVTQKIDPTLVKTIGESEGKAYYTLKPQIVVQAAR